MKLYNHLFLFLSVSVLSFVLVFSSCRSDASEKDISREGQKNEKLKTENPKDASSKTGYKIPALSSKLEPAVKTIPSDLEKKVFQNPGLFLPDLVKHLDSKASNDAEKVKLFHDWIALNISYDVESYFSDNLPDQSYEAVIKNRSSVCEGISNVMKQMCDFAGIECVKVPGYSRGYGQRVFDKVDFTEANHVWNAVKIDGQWLLLDATWDAGYIDKDKYYKKYSTDYLFIKPQQMLYTHFPEEEKWQLLDQPMSAANAANLPDLKGLFFGYDLELSENIDKISQVNGKYELSIKTPENVYLSANVVDKKGRKLPNTTFVQKQDGVSLVNFIFPEKGNYIGRIYVRKTNEESYAQCADFGFENVARNKESFPKVFQQFEEFNCLLKSPVYGPLKTGEEVLFDLRSTKVKKAVLYINEQFYDLEEENSGRFVLKQPMPKTKKAQLFIGISKEDTKLKGILEWDVK